MRRIPVLILAAGVAAALMPGVAQAASFPCTSFLHQLRVGKFGEKRAERMVKHFAEMARKHAQGEDTKQFVSGDLSQEAFWRGDLHYLRALDDRIGQEDCGRFDYRGVVRWINARSRHLQHERDVHDSKGTPEEDQKFEYAQGGLRALGPNKVKIKRIAGARGVPIS